MEVNPDSIDKAIKADRVERSAKLRNSLLTAGKIGGWLLPAAVTILLAVISARDSLRANTAALHGVQVELAALRVDVSSKVTMPQVEARIQAELSRLRITESLAELNVHAQRNAEAIREIRDALRNK